MPLFLYCVPGPQLPTGWDTGPGLLQCSLQGPQSPQNPGRAAKTFLDKGVPTPSNNTWDSEALWGWWAEDPASIFLASVPLTVEFLVHDPQGGEEIAKEEDEEGEATHEYLGEEAGLGWAESSPPSIPSRAPAHLPLPALGIPGQVEQRQRVIKLPELGGRGSHIERGPCVCQSRGWTA